MGFWSYIRDMFVFDWLFGHRKKESFWEQPQQESQRCDSYFSHDEGGYSHYHHNDYPNKTLMMIWILVCLMIYEQV